jgi:hypothetical protein
LVKNASFLSNDIFSLVFGVPESLAFRLWPFDRFSSFSFAFLLLLEAKLESFGEDVVAFIDLWNPSS